MYKCQNSFESPRYHTVPLLTEKCSPILSHSYTDVYKRQVRRVFVNVCGRWRSSPPIPCCQTAVCAELIRNEVATATTTALKLFVRSSDATVNSDITLTANYAGVIFKRRGVCWLLNTRQASHKVYHSAADPCCTHAGCNSQTLPSNKFAR